MNKDSRQIKSHMFGDLADEMEALSQKKRWQIWWEIISLLLFSSAVVVVLVNLLVSSKLSWSAYPLITCAGLWILTTLICFYHRHPFMLLIGSSIDTILLLLAIDGIDGRLTWLLPLGIPIAVGFFVMMALVISMGLLLKRRGLNIIALGLFCASLYCIEIEIAVDFHHFGLVKVGWSALAFVSITPVVALLLFLHFRLRKYLDFRRNIQR